jgi:hypothetical protein
MPTSQTTGQQSRGFLEHQYYVDEQTRAAFWRYLEEPRSTALYCEQRGQALDPPQGGLERASRELVVA